jgi:hypothetical protein
MINAVPRLTTRRLMLLVLLAAIALGLSVEIANRRRRAEYARARGAYQAAMGYFDFGKITLMNGILASERIMNSELSLWHTKEDEIAAISAHLSRAHDMIEKMEPLALDSTAEEDIAEAELRLASCKERLSHLTSTG